MAKVRVTKDEYTAEGRKFQKTLEELNKLACFIGFQHGNGTEEDGTDLCDVAAWNELGTSLGIPSRPFIRNTVDLHQDESMFRMHRKRSEKRNRINHLLIPTV